MVFNDLYEILRKKGKPKMMIGVTGFVGSGKTFFSKEFAQFLNEKNINSINFNMDIYNSTTRAERNEIISSLDKKYDPFWPKKAYAQNHDLIREHLTNIKQEKSFSADNLCNPQTKELNFAIKFLFNKDSTIVNFGENENQYKGNNSWVIYDGVKIMEHREFFDYIIFLNAEYTTRFNRILDRNNKLPSPAKIKENLFKNVEDGLSLDHNLSEKHAHIIIDNNDFENRTITKREY
ncbi:MAG: P-loop NTPase fold protein [Nanoarchaeota archaeon]